MLLKAALVFGCAAVGNALAAPASDTRLLYTLLVGDSPAAVVNGVFFDGKYVWIANNGVNTNSVTKFDAASRTMLATYLVGRNPDGVAHDGTYIWVTNSYSNDVWTLNRDTGQQVAGYATGTFPLSMVYDGQNMWIGNGTGVNVGPPVPGIGSLTKIRAADGTNLGTFTVGHHVRGLAYDGTSIWACNGNDNTVSCVRASDVALLATYPTGKAPSAVAFDGANIWVANAGENSLTIIASQPIPTIVGGHGGHPPGTAPPLSGTLRATKSVTAHPAVPAQSLRPALNFLLDSN